MHNESIANTVRSDSGDCVSVKVTDPHYDTGTALRTAPQ